MRRSDVSIGLVIFPIEKSVLVPLMKIGYFTTAFSFKNPLTGKMTKPYVIISVDAAKLKLISRGLTL